MTNESICIMLSDNDLCPSEINQILLLRQDPEHLRSTTSNVCRFASLCEHNEFKYARMTKHNKMTHLTSIIHNRTG